MSGIPDWASREGDTAARGIHFTNHTDFLVTPLDSMFTVWTAVNRTTKSGKVLGPDERITPLQALRAITSDAAYQYREERERGTLEVGSEGCPSQAMYHPRVNSLVLHASGFG